MSHIVEVDQSIRVDDTSDDTILAFANGLRYSVLIPSTVKRECLHVLRDFGYSGETLYFQIFAIALFFLLKDAIEQLSTVYIDAEYPGHENLIKVYVLNLLRRVGKNVNADQIQFTHVGKQSPAHKLALDTLRKRQQPNVALSVEDIVGQFRRGRKTKGTRQ